MFEFLFEKANTFYEKVFFVYGRFLAKNYIKIICISFLVNLALSLGILRIQMISDTDSLFFPDKSQARMDERLLKNIYNNSTRLTNDFYLHQILDFGTWAEVNFQLKNKSNILKENFLKEILGIHEKILEIPNFKTACAKRNGECIIDGVDLLEPDFYETFLHAAMEKKASKDDWTDEDDKKNFRFFINPNKVSFTDLTYNLGKHFRVNFINESNYLTEPGFSKLVKLRYNLKDNFENASQEVKDWELKFLELMKSLSNSDYFKISYASSQSLDQEMAANIIVDTKLIVGTFSLIIVFACLIMSLGSNMLTSPGYTLPFAGITSALFGITSSFGICSYFNYAGCNLIYVIPFLVIGIGIDDMFIIYSSFLHSYKSKDKSNDEIIEDLMSRTLARSGVSITITSLTDFVAFMVGVTTGFKSVQIFCIYAGISIFFCYFYQLTFFSGFLCLHAKRILSNRNSFLPCLKVKPETEKKSGDKKSKIFIKFKKSWLKIFKFLICNKIGKLITLVLFVIYISFSVYNAVQIHEGIKLQDLVSEESYYSAYVNDNSELNDLHPIVMLVMTKPLNYDSAQTRLTIKNLLSNAQKIDGISTSFKLNWLDWFKSTRIDYKHSATQLVQQLEAYPPLLNDLVISKKRLDSTNQTVKSIYKLNDVDEDSEYEIESSRFYLQYSKLFLSSLDAKPMHMLRKVCQESGLPVIPYSITFKFYEQFEETLPNVIQAFIIALESMYIISLIFIPDLVSVFCIIVSMLSIMTGLLGFMHLWGLSLSSITMIELIMSVGFCVDFSAHVTHAFIAISKGDRNRRAYKAFLHVGVPIFNSALSTVIGISLLGFCKSYIFKSFFKTMTILMALGVMNSLLFLPVLLSVIGPNWPRHKLEKRNMNGDKVNDLEMIELNGHIKETEG